jgi:hypothetical protein
MHAVELQIAPVVHDPTPIKANLEKGIFPVYQRGLE